MTGAVDTGRFPFPRLTSLAVLLLFLPAVPVCLAQAEEPEADEEEATRPKYITFDRVDAYLEVKGEFRHSRVNTETPRGRGQRRDYSQRNQEWRFEERIGLGLSGSIIDPSLIVFDGEFAFGLSQERYEETFLGERQVDSDDGYLTNYDFRIGLFQGKQLSGQVFGLRQDDRIPRRFQPSLDQEKTSLGTSWNYVDDVFPMHFSYSFLDTRSEGNRDRRDDEHYRENNFFFSLDFNYAEHGTHRLSYEHTETRQEYQGLRQAFNTDRDLLISDLEQSFGSDYQHRWTSTTRFQDERGDFARDLFDTVQELKFRHGEDLSTSYRLQYLREKYEGLDVQQTRADFQLVHQWYSNLTTTLNVFGLFENIKQDADTDQYGASVDWQYNRSNDWGRLYANLALAYDRENVTGNNGRRVILDESHTFNDPLDIALQNRNVVPGTIVVTDTSGRRLYRGGIDYVIYFQSNLARIARVRSGQIADGDTVLVDYQFNTPADGQIDTTRVDFSLEQRFDFGLTPYYRFAFRNQEEDVSEGFPNSADRTDHHRLGLTFEKERYTLGAEYEIYDDTIDPYTAFHLDGMYRFVQTKDYTISGSARFSRLFFKGDFDDRNVSMLDASLDHRLYLGEAWSTIERLGFRWEDDSVDGITQGWDVTAGLEYDMGDLRAELTFEYDRLELPDSDDEDYGVFFRMRRDVRNVFGRR